MSIFVRLQKLLKIVTRRWSTEKVTSTVTINFISSSSFQLYNFLAPVYGMISTERILFFASIYTDISRQLCKWTPSLRQTSHENQRKAQLLHCSQNILSGIATQDLFSIFALSNMFCCPPSSFRCWHENNSHRHSQPCKYHINSWSSLLHKQETSGARS